MRQPPQEPKQLPFGSNPALVRNPLLCLGALLVVLAVSLEPRELQAGNHSLLGPDFDQDGLADTQELVIGTLPDSPDTDLDGYYDLEELTRGSDPLALESVPGVEPLLVRMYAYLEDDILALHTSIYVDDGLATSDLSFELGVVLDGIPITVARSTYGSAAQHFFFNSSHDPNDVILVLEMPVPEWVVHRLGQLDVYSIVRDNGINPRPDSIDLKTFVSQNETVMEIVDAPPLLAAQKGGGIVYRPLTGDGSSPPSANPGQICWQSVAPVGTNGSNIVYEVEDASCEDFDSFCNSGDCSSNVGTVLELPDPGSILGG